MDTAAPTRILRRRLKRFELAIDARMELMEAIDADDRLDALEAIGTDSRLDALEAINAGSRLTALEAKPLRGSHSHDIGTLQSSGTFTITDSGILSSHRLMVIETGNTGAPLNLRVESITNGSAVIGWTATLQSGTRTFWWMAV